MRIDVISTDDSTTPEARAYAEYRLFATLVRHTRVIRSVRVVLGHAERSGSTSRVTCAVDLVLKPSGSVRARACGPHAVGAIDRAAERMGDLMAGKSVGRISSAACSFASKSIPRTSRRLILSSVRHDPYVVRVVIGVPTVPSSPRASSRTFSMASG